MNPRLSDYVDPTIGTLPVMLAPTIPEVLLPHGMMGAAPVIAEDVSDRYLVERIHGFTFGYVTRRCGMRTRIVPVTGAGTDLSSECDNDFATVRPHYASYRLDDYGIDVEYTVTQRAAVFRFTFPKTADAGIVLDIRGSGSITELTADTVAGYEERRRHRMYIHAQVSRPGDARHELEGDATGVRYEYATSAGEQILLKVGISYIDAEQARENLRREIPDWDFERVRDEAQSEWDTALGRVRVDGGTRKQRTIFYTALYRCLSRMRDHDEYGRYHSPADGKTHDADGHAFYMHDWSWDTHRTAHPLQCLIEPERRDDIVQSYVRMFEQSGWFPTFPTMHGGAGYFMVGFPSHAIVLDAYQKGFRGFDVRKAYEGMRNNAVSRTRIPPHRSDDVAPGALDRFYFDNGYMPALKPGEQETEKAVTFWRQCVSVTLEHSYSDWCLAEMARELGIDADAERFGRMAMNYRNVFRPDIGFMAPKDADGNWVEPFDPIWSGGQGGREYYTENNAWIYTFYVPHDPEGLTELYGGPEGLRGKLDTLFTTHLSGEPKWRFFDQWPDGTGLIGMYCHGNEPSFNIPYLYNYAGAPWRAQKRVRQIMDLMYTDMPQGLCGDDDQGTLSAWYVFSAMGFYPLCPGKLSYEIGSPLFERAVLDLGGGRSFTVEAPGTSTRAKYIRAASLDGAALSEPRFGHADAFAGTSVLRLEMDERPAR